LVLMTFATLAKCGKACFALLPAYESRTESWRAALLGGTPGRCGRLFVVRLFWAGQGRAEVTEDMQQ
jgi:hypothetical protein